MAVPGFVNNLLVSGVIDGVIHLTSAMENDTGSSKEEDISASIWEIMIRINIKVWYVTRKNVLELVRQ